MVTKKGSHRDRDVAAALAAGVEPEALGLVNVGGYLVAAAGAGPGGPSFVVDTHGHPVHHVHNGSVAPLVVGPGGVVALGAAAQNGQGAVVAIGPVALGGERDRHHAHRHHRHAHHDLENKDETSKSFPRANMRCRF